MSTAAPPQPPPTRLATSNERRAAKPLKFQEDITERRPSAIVVNTTEGWGKTTLAAFAPNSTLALARDETGYQTLRGVGRVPRRKHVTVNTWSELLTTVATLEDVKILALDTLGGFERLCHEHVCDTSFNGDWGDKGFLSYHKGYDQAISEWLKLLQALDRLRNTQGTSVLMLSHCQIRPFKNPLGPDYDRFVSDCHPKTWGVTHRWADAVLFGKYYDIVQEDKKSGGRLKGVGEGVRMLYTERTAGYDAKNRFGMAQAIEFPNDPLQMWPTFAAAIQGESLDV